MKLTQTMQTSLEVEIDDHPLGLRVHVQGEETYENTLAYWLMIAPRLETAQGKGLLLIDELLGPPMSEQQWLELVLTMEYAQLWRYRIAHVKPRGLKEVEYCELFARDANLDAKVFTDEREAERWLGEGRH
ncbi:hypothetical protein ACFOLC_12130 [Lysobacter cavernae]|uniref:STAS/SEC14 domain-containing protein n=1 Tax=Lysobacter cavernae TaxID=1685901 RepID=A0ABV7RQV7_9GAMM